MITEHEYQMACDDIAAHKSERIDALAALPLDGLTPQQKVHLIACVGEFIDDAHADRIEELESIRDLYEGAELRAHERSESTHLRAII